MIIELARGDLARTSADAVVNAANSGLLGGGGVDGALHHAAGPGLLAACRAVRATTWPDGLPTGEAVATPAGRLAARWVIHTVGPIYPRSPDPAGELTTAYRRCLEVADEVGARSVAFPSLSTGAYGYPLEEAAPIALTTVSSTPCAVERVRFVLLGGAAFDAFARAARSTGVPVVTGAP